jgi:uncharacterized iron-regulated membrane protein
MNSLQETFRKITRFVHLWLGLVTGLFVCLMAVTGGLVTFRPQIAMLLSPSAIRTATCAGPLDWNRVEQEVKAFGHSEINRIYGPLDGDTRYRFRMMTDRNAIYTHVIYDACAAKVLGFAPLSWMDWFVDLHHNLLNGRVGRTWAGYMGIALLASTIGGLFLWLLSNPKVQEFYRLRTGPTVASASRNLHRTTGLLAGSLLFLGAFTGMWMCFPQTVRTMLTWVAPVPAETRVPRRPKTETPGPPASLGAIFSAAQHAIPDGVIREVRMPEGNGNVPVRMWRSGDFRWLGNNVVTVDSRSGQALAVELYADKPAPNRFIQAMAGLHYGEWGGLTFRAIYGIAGFLAALLFITGFLMWWLGRRRRGSVPAPAVSQRAEENVSVVSRLSTRSS